MKPLNLIMQILLIIGGINWGLVGLFDFNLVAALFGVNTILSSIIYTLVGISALYGLYLLAPIAKGTHIEKTRTRTATSHRS